MENKGEVLRIIRIAKDKKIKDVAENKDISLSYLSEVENGKKAISERKLKMLLKVYNISATQFKKFVLYYNKFDNRFTKSKKYQLTLLEVLKYYCGITKKE